MQQLKLAILVLVSMKLNIAVNLQLKPSASLLVHTILDHLNTYCCSVLSGSHDAIYPFFGKNGPTFTLFSFFFSFFFKKKEMLFVVLAPEF